MKNLLLIHENARTLVHAKRLFFLLLLSLIGINQVYADATINTTIQSNVFLATYGSTTGKLYISSGGVLVMNSDLTLPDTITEIIIQDGGKIQYTGNFKLTLGEATVLTIENTSITDVTNSAAAIYVPQDVACNNNVSIYIGNVKYSACTGQGNVCLLFGLLIAQGGSLKLTPSVNVAGIGIVGNNVCSSTPGNTNFSLVGHITQNTSLVTAPTYEWTTVNKPEGATDPVFGTPDTAVTNVQTTMAGTYTFRITITQNLSTGGRCNIAQSKFEDITLNIIASPTATASGGGFLRHYVLPTQDATVTFTGSAGTPQYTINYTLNGVPQPAVTTTGGTFSITQSSTDTLGIYEYAITQINDAICTTNVTNQSASIIISESLPIHLVEFKATNNKCAVTLNWLSGKEDQFSHFEIQKSENGAKDFETIGIVDAKGSNNKYLFVDNKANYGLISYRLKLVDEDGTISYSKVAMVNSTCNEITITPTLVSGEGVVIVNGLITNDVIEIVGLEGKILLSQIANSSKEMLNISSFRNGIYIVNINRSGVNMVVQKIEKQ